MLSLSTRVYLVQQILLSTPAIITCHLLLPKLSCPRIDCSYRPLFIFYLLFFKFIFFLNHYVFCAILYVYHTYMNSTVPLRCLPSPCVCASTLHIISHESIQHSIHTYIYFSVILMPSSPKFSSPHPAFVVLFLYLFFHANPLSSSSTPASFLRFPCPLSRPLYFFSNLLPYSSHHSHDSVFVLVLSSKLRYVIYHLLHFLVTLHSSHYTTHPPSTTKGTPINLFPCTHFLTHNNTSATLPLLSPLSSN